MSNNILDTLYKNKSTNKLYKKKKLCSQLASWDLKHVNERHKEDKIDIKTIKECIQSAEIVLLTTLYKDRFIIYWEKANIIIFVKILPVTRKGKGKEKSKQKRFRYVCITAFRPDFTLRYGLLVRFHPNRLYVVSQLLIRYKMV